jgi:hypothetical protein
MKPSLLSWIYALPFAAAALGIPTAHAELADEIQVLTDEIGEPGEFGVEMHINTTPKGRRTPDYPGEATPHRGLRLTPEFTWGLTRTMEAAVALPFNRDLSGNTSAAGVKAGLKWLPVRPAKGEAGWFAGAATELSWLKQRFSESRSTIELKPIVGWRNYDWLLALNPVVGWNLSEGMRSRTADASLNAKLARTAASGTALGLEYYSGLGTTAKILPYKQQANTLFVTVDAEVRGWGINFGIGRGLTRDADDLTVKATLGVPFGS